METMQSKRSLDDCPWCGEHEWNCYYVNGLCSEERGAEEACKFNRPLVDLNHCPGGFLDSRLVDECAYCGAVVS